MHTVSPAKLRYQIAVFLVATFLVSSSANAVTAINQQPLLVAQPVPGNLAIIGSFEFPTMVTRAHKSENYNSNTTYVGYFDSNKYYQYNYHTDEKQRHFFPVSFKSNTAKGDNDWDGNFLNWSTMQTIDIFRHILTGGHRFVDEIGETWLEKGVQTGQGSDTNFPVGYLNNNSLVKSATPADWDKMKTRIGAETIKYLLRPDKVRALGNLMRFARTVTIGNDLTEPGTPYNPSEHTSLSTSTVYEVSIRVKVCVPALLEDNCEKYSENNYKPTGLIQQYADKLRFSAFGYLNDSSLGSSGRNRTGGVMHARMKYVGPKKLTSTNTKIDNPNKEWDPTTGIFRANPDPLDAADTEDSSGPLEHSGVISYINLSGHIVEGTEFKRHDNVGELYYTAYRYLKGLPNIKTYTNISEVGSARDKLIGGLPVITKWRNKPAAGETLDDPIQFYCQKNFFLGIGDTNTPADGGLATVGRDDDALFPSLFTKLNDVIKHREGIRTNLSTSTEHLPAIAYDANTADLRPDMPGKQTISTYWIDILEKGLASSKDNPYWLASKYGGFKVPEKFDPTKKTQSFSDSLWWTSGDILSSRDKRPDNFYVVSEADELIESMIKAFANIQAEQSGSRASLAVSSNKLESDSKAFQTQYVSGAWSGNVHAYAIDEETGALSSEPLWNAESELPKWDERKVYVNIDGGLIDFKTKGSTLSGFDKNKAEYLLGNRIEENKGSYRTREGVLGDMVNSQPAFVGNPKADLFNRKTFPGSNLYRSWAKDIKDINRTPMVYIGGNDGMLHGFNATTGAEVFAFIPKTVVANGLSELADKDYVHRYFVDGEITVADVYIGGNWKTILVGTLGAGGVNKARTGTNNAVFALDVTNPGKPLLLWEKNSSDIPHLGISLGKPVILQDQANNWKVVLGNGPNSQNDKAHLLSINLATGITTAPLISSKSDNGLSAIRAWDSDGDGLTDTLYAGDMLGELWKITNLNSPNPTNTKLFTAKNTAGNPQPITTLPLVEKSPYDGTVWLFFGTGRYLSSADLLNTQVQSWYGIKDSGAGNFTRGNLLQRKIMNEFSVTTADGASNIARIIEKGNRSELLTKQGWYIDLYRMLGGTATALGERMVTPNQLKSGALIGNSRIPDASDPCAPSGAGVLMSIDPFTGGSLPNSFFDINNDGVVNTSDLVNGQVVSGIGLAIGSSNPSFIGDVMYLPSDEATISVTESAGSEVFIDPDDLEGGLKPERTSWRELMNPED